LYFLISKPIIYIVEVSHVNIKTKAVTFFATVALLAQSSIAPKPAQAGWFVDSLITDALTAGYDYDKDVIDKKRAEAGKDIERSKLQRKIFACTLGGPWLFDKCRKDWDTKLWWEVYSE
jgi:hypothetical protein